jgi:hypothetical protein
MATGAIGSGILTAICAGLDGTDTAAAVLAVSVLTTVGGRGGTAGGGTLDGSTALAVVPVVRGGSTLDGSTALAVVPAVRGGSTLDGSTALAVVPAVGGELLMVVGGACTVGRVLRIGLIWSSCSMAGTTTSTSPFSLTNASNPASCSSRKSE